MFKYISTQYEYQDISDGILLIMIFEWWRSDNKSMIMQINKAAILQLLLFKLNGITTPPREYHLT